MKQRPVVSASDRVSVYCIVLNWNGWQDTVACLESLYRTDNSNLSVLVVDNGSTNDSIAQIRQKFPTVEIVETGQNLGFAGGNNVGIRIALERSADYVWLLNNDTTVTSSTLDALVRAAQGDPQLGQIGSVLCYMSQPDKVQAWGGGEVNLLTGRTSHFHGPIENDDLDYLTAASVLLPAKVLQQVGLLDSDYFMYWEDTDLSFRIRRAGWKLGVASNALVLHKESASSAGRSPTLDRYMTASGIRFLRRYARFPRIAIALMICGRAAKRFVLLDWKRGWAVIAGLSGY